MDFREVCTDPPMAGVWSSRATPSADPGTAPTARLHPGLLIGPPDAGLPPLTETRTSLAGCQSRLLERRSQVRKGQVTLAATALDQVINARRARLLVLSRSGSCDPRHETPPSICCMCAYDALHCLPTRLNDFPDDKK